MLYECTTGYGRLSEWWSGDRQTGDSDVGRMQCMYICTYIRTHICTYVCTYLCMHVCVLLCVHVRACAYVYVFLSCVPSSALMKWVKF